MACWRLELLITFQLVEGVTSLGGCLWRGYNETEVLNISPHLPTSRSKKKKTKNKSRLLHVDRMKLAPSSCRMGKFSLLSLLFLLPNFTMYLSLLST